MVETCSLTLYNINKTVVFKHYWDPIRVHSPLRLETYQGPEDDHMNGRNM